MYKRNWNPTPPPTPAVAPAHMALSDACKYLTDNLRGAWNRESIDNLIETVEFFIARAKKSLAKTEPTPKKEVIDHPDAICADGVTGHLLYLHGAGIYCFRVYDGAGGYVDYDIRHSDVVMKIIDTEAYFYRRPNSDTLDHAPDTLGMG